MSNLSLLQREYDNFKCVFYFYMWIREVQWSLKKSLLVNLNSGTTETHLKSTFLFRTEES